MPLVEVHAGEIVAEGLKRSDATNAKQVLLPHTCAIIPSIEASTETDELSRVVWMERVEEIDRYHMAANADDLGFPNAGVEG